MLFTHNNNNNNIQYRQVRQATQTFKVKLLNEEYSCDNRHTRFFVSSHFSFCS